MNKRCINKQNLLLLLMGILLFSSCVSYKNGFIQSFSSEYNQAEIDVPMLQQKKEQLRQNSEIIVASIRKNEKNKQAIYATDINQLFENLHQHYQIDTVFHQLYFSAEKDSIKQLAFEKMVESASLYHVLFENDKNIRRNLNRGDQAFDIQKKTHLHSQKFLWSPSNRQDFKNVVQNKKERGSKCRFLCRKHTDNCKETFYKTVGFISEIFGRLVTKVHKKPDPETNVSRLMPHLKKWDIIVQKSPGHLTDKFIPGYFGHAAIYLGDSIFAESLQKGTVKNNPYKFAEGESFLIIRQKDISEEQEKRMEKLLNGQFGKKYDFNFNAESADKITCTELVYFVFDNIQWDTKKSIGRFTISPDQLVETAIKNEQLYFPLFFDKKQVIKNPEKEFVKQLICE